MKKRLDFAANTDRLIDDFLTLTSIDSVSLQERELADALIPKLRELGCEVEEDDAAQAIGGNCGNILARLPGRPDEMSIDTGAPETDQSEAGEPDAAPDDRMRPILLCAHMDTVVPGKGKKAHLEDGESDTIIRGNGEAVLGADDVTGIVEILEGLRILEENQIPHRPVELLFTVSEETYVGGSIAFDLAKIQSKEAYVMDLTGPIGRAAVKAPSLILFEVTVTGRPAHAGFEPHRGIHAIQAASAAIARLPEGQLDEETTFNIGVIRGGARSNIVPDQCRVIGEVRSYDHEKALEAVERMRTVFAEETEKLGAGFELKADTKIRAYCWDEDTAVCRRFRRAAEAIGAAPEDGEMFVSTFGGSDNNIFAERGLEGIVPSCGMYDPHSIHEYTKVSDLKKGAQLVAALCVV